MKVISVLMSAFNADQYIVEAIQSILDQKLPSGWILDLKIGVDGCTKTAEVLNKNFIPYYFSSSNVGTYIISNSLLDLAYKSGSNAFVRFDSDDIALENFIKNGIENLTHRDLVRSSYIEIDSLGNVLDNKKIKSSYGSIFFNRTVVDRLGGYYHYKVSCDKDFIQRARAIGLKTNKVTTPSLYYYRRHSTSLTLSNDTSSVSNFRREIELQLQNNLKSNIFKIVPELTELKYINSFKD